MSSSKRIRLTRTKKSYACFFCNKIINRPVKLPCDASVCYEHIKNLSQSVFDCQSCQREHVVPEKGFEYNDELQEQIDTDIYLTKSECEQKKAINELFKERLNTNASNKGPLFISSTKVIVINNIHRCSVFMVLLFDSLPFFREPRVISWEQQGRSS